MTWGNVHVFLPPDGDVDVVVGAAMAPYRAGGSSDLPESMLAFHDRTECVRDMHGGAFMFRMIRTGGLGVDGPHLGLLDTGFVRKSMQALDLENWKVRFSDIVPSLDVFFDRYVRGLVRDPVTGRFGIWANPVGEWDAWELGRHTFTGDMAARSGKPFRVGARSDIEGRLIEGDVEAFLAGAGDPDPGSDVLAPGRRLAGMLADGTLDEPLALLLPAGDGPDADRWISSWPRIGPPGGLRLLGVSDTCEWERIVSAAYARHPEVRVANVGYHF